MIKRIAVITSGGDSPGMNAALRAIVRTATYNNIEVFGFMQAYKGMIDNDYIQLNSRSVANTIQRGGTIIRSARCEEFKTPEGRDKAAANLKALEIEALLVIGGDGSLQGASLLAEHWPGQIIGLPGTIDNDLWGTDYTIGYFTALDTALDAIDKIRDTADAIDRVFLIEVMGRMAGFIAEGVGIAGGAEETLVPEREIDIDAMISHIDTAKRKGKVSFIVVIAEGAYPGGAVALSKTLEEKSGIGCRACVLGHIQRGGSPSALDRILASQLGSYSVEQAIQGQTLVMAGIINNELTLTPLEKTWQHKKSLNSYLFGLQKILSQ
ncbi:6-phosphofructokinase [Pseudomonadota bacterium]